MQETEPSREVQRRPRWHHRLGEKLIISLLLTLVVIFALLGFLIVRLHRQHLEAAALLSAERVSDVLKRSTTSYMLRNDRAGLHQLITTMGTEPGMVRVRIFDPDGRIGYSTEQAEINHSVDMNAEACYGCHTQSQPLTRLKRNDRFRVFRANGGGRILGIITPIENQAACSSAPCHAHPESQQILGVLDTNMSLAKADLQLAQDSWRMVAYTFFAMIAMASLSAVFVWRVVKRPLRMLHQGTERLAKGDLGYQIEVRTSDELGDLAESFNSMSLQLRAANEEIVSWAHTLEQRVEEKTRALRSAHDQMLLVEKMASIGKMAAVVAHEINNPLSGILTYAKLIRKWVDAGTSQQHQQEAHECLDLIASESHRCGELVKNLLTFSRVTPMHTEPVELPRVVEHLVRLVNPKLEMAGIQLQQDFPPGLPRLCGDNAQIEQLLLALVMNAIDAMPRGGNIWIKARPNPDTNELVLEVRDDGPGIPADILPHIFDPFMTTKENGHGVGLGLAISHSIVERHHGHIKVQTEAGRGTTFTVTLPIAGADSPLVSTAMISGEIER
jgi:two-component system, NtrC family, sensor kinase